MSYLLWDDITDKVVRAFGEADLAEYFDETDQEINDLAEQLGVRDSDDVETNDNGTIKHYKIKRFGINYFCSRVCFDKSQGVLTSGEPDKYWTKYEHYLMKVEQLRKEISKSMFRDQVNEIADRANSRTVSMFRG